MNGKTNKISIKADKTGMVVCIDKIMSAQDICCELYKRFNSNKEVFAQGGMINISFRNYVPDLRDQKEIVDFLNNMDMIKVTFRLKMDTECALPKESFELSRYTEEHTGRRPDNGCACCEPEIYRNMVAYEKPYVFRGSIHRKQTLEIKGGIIILGNVEKDAVVISGKSIIVIGEIAGTASAGRIDSNSFIAALRMNPQLLQIGSSTDYGQVFRYAKPYPMIATNDDNIINITYV